MTAEALRGDPEKSTSRPAEGSEATIARILSDGPADRKTIARLAGLKSLRELRLDHVSVSDASLKVLTGLVKLRYVDLYHTLLSEPGFETLKKSLPDCDINWNKDSTKRERRS